LLELPDKSDIDKKFDVWQAKNLNLTQTSMLLNLWSGLRLTPLYSYGSKALLHELLQGTGFALLPASPDWKTQIDACVDTLCCDLKVFSSLLKMDFDKQAIRLPFSEKKTKDVINSLCRHSKRTLEDSGIDPLYVAYGGFAYRDAQGKKRIAPILLYPARIMRTKSGKAQSAYTLELREPQPQINHTLLIYLEKTHKISLAELELLDENTDPQSVFATLRQATLSIHNCELLIDTMYCGIFSFAGQALWEDLNHREALLRTPLIRNLAEGTPIHNRQSVFGNTDEGFPLPIPTDSSQRAAIRHSQNGNLVLHGPPGTGKTVSLVGMIAQALLANETVLVSADKTHALLVIKERMEELGLGACCLDLRTVGDSVAHVLKQLEDCLLYTSDAADE
jgi:hypothetical protein